MRKHITQRGGNILPLSDPRANQCFAADRLCAEATIAFALTAMIIHDDVVIGVMQMFHHRQKFRGNTVKPGI